MITLVILGILASVALPLTQMTVQRNKEQELRFSLRQIRDAIDNYKQAADDGRISKSVGDTGYPKSLEVLMEGVVDIKDPRHRKIYFLRELPRDPMSTDSSEPSQNTWGKRSYESSHDDPQEGDDIFDVYSRSTTTGLNGISYREW